MTFSPDGEWLAVSDQHQDRGTTRLIPLGPSNTKTIVLGTHEPTVLDLEFSPNGNTLAVAANRTGEAFLGELATGPGAIWMWPLNAEASKPYVYRGHEAPVDRLAFSPDGLLIASADETGTIRLWPVGDSQAEPIILRDHVYREHGREMNTLMFAPDGSNLLAVYDDGTILIWTMQIEFLLTEARRATARNLTLPEWQGAFPGEAFRPTFLDLPYPTYDETYRSIARNLSLAEWSYYFPGKTYRKTFDDLGVPTDGKTEDGEQGEN